MYLARKARGLGQVEVCEKLGISQGTLSELENRSAGSRRTVDFAALYNVNPTWLATGKGDRAASAHPPPAGTTALFVAEPTSEDASLTHSELADLVQAVLDLPRRKAQDLLRQLMLDAEEYRQYGKTVLRRFGATGTASNERVASALPPPPSRAAPAAPQPPKRTKT